MATSRTGKEACDLLDADHRAIKKLFKTYEELAGSRARSASQKKLDLSRRIGQELTVHLQIEEELFYPALRAVVKDTVLLDVATVEDDLIKELVAQIQQGEGHALTDARVRVLGESIDRHIKQQRNAMFPKARAARKLDLITLAEQLEARKQTLLMEMTDTGALGD